MKEVIIFDSVCGELSHKWFCSCAYVMRVLFWV